LTGREIAERNGQNVADEPIHASSRAIRMTISLEFVHALPGDAIERVTARADAALHRSKQRGRNRVVMVLRPAHAPIIRPREPRRVTPREPVEPGYANP